MIKGILASNAAKLVAACVCPVAGTVGLTVASPKIRQKVHQATAPRAYALPKTRVRQVPAATPANDAPIQTALAAPPCEPVLAAGPIDRPFAPASFSETNPAELQRLGDLGGVVGGGDVGTGGTGGGVVGGVNPVLPLPPGVPEPATWLNLIVGFGVIGGAARYSLRRGPDPDEFLEKA